MNDQQKLPVSVDAQKRELGVAEAAATRLRTRMMMIRVVLGVKRRLPLIRPRPLAQAVYSLLELETVDLMNVMWAVVRMVRRLITYPCLNWEGAIFAVLMMEIATMGSHLQQVA